MRLTDSEKCDKIMYIVFCGGIMNIFGYSLQKLQDHFVEIGENPAKAAILYDGIYRRGMRDFRGYGFAERVVTRLERDFTFELPKILEKRENETAAKLLLEMSDGELAETVLMRQRFGNCVCVSTQIGCNMGCKFCQSGLMKRRRNLTPAEIVGQVFAISEAFSCKINGISVMGIGEPFDNFDAVSTFCSIASEDCGMAVGRRHITVSTCGVVPRIYDYADSARSCSLAISLHAPNDALRNDLMPINRRYPISEVMSAARYFLRKTHHRVAFEYLMLKGINDSPDHARELAALIGDDDFYVNLIPYNTTDNEFCKSTPDEISKFCGILKEHGVISTKRHEFGANLNAACGQLRSNYTKYILKSP